MLAPYQSVNNSNLLVCPNPYLRPLEQRYAIPDDYGIQTMAIPLSKTINQCIVYPSCARNIKSCIKFAAADLFLNALGSSVEKGHRIAVEKLASQPENYLQRPPKVNAKYKKEEFRTKPETSSSNIPPKMDPKYTKDEFPALSKSPQTPESHNCLPKSGQYDPHDVAFYEKIASSPEVSTVRSLKYVPDRRCAGTLYLRAEDTNYLHEKDHYLRAEDSHPIGEIPSSVGEKLINDGRVWYKTVEKAGDICKRIDEVKKLGGKIKRLVLVGHGNSQEILLSQKDSDNNDIFKRFFGHNTGTPFDLNRRRDHSRSSDDWFLFMDPFGSNDLFNAKSISKETGMDDYIIDTSTRFPKKGCLNDLEPEANIVLISCSTGKGSDNIADSIAKQAPGHHVVAPNNLLSMSHGVKAKKVGGNLKLYFENDKGKDMTYAALAKKTSR